MSVEGEVEPKKPFLVGFARVSMDDQDNSRQVEELIRYGVDRRDVFTDKASGRDMKRPGWGALWRDIREGDVVVILALDRLGRDVLRILQTVEAMKLRGVGLKVLTGGVDYDTPIGRFVFTQMAAFAQLERELITTSGPSTDWRGPGNAASSAGGRPRSAPRWCRTPSRVRATVSR